MSTTEGHDDVTPGPGRTRRGSAVAATALAAVLLMGIGLVPAAAATDGGTVPPARPGTGAAAAERFDPQAEQRLIGVAEDLAEAVTHGEITAEQAERFLQQVCERLAA